MEPNYSGPAMFERFTAMKCFLILLISFAFICAIKATIIADMIIEGLPIKVLSSGKTYKVFEQYPWEGHSSNYGPKGNRLSPGNGVGVGRNIARSLQLRLGDWIHMPDIGWRQINESSSKNDGIEFFATHRDEYNSKHPRITIDRVVFALRSQKFALRHGSCLRTRELDSSLVAARRKAGLQQASLGLLPTKAAANSCESIDPTEAHMH